MDAVVAEHAAAGVVVARRGRATAVQQTSFVFFGKFDHVFYYSQIKTILEIVKCFETNLHVTFVFSN